MGAGPVEVAIVAEEIGRVLAPEPFIETVVLAGGPGRRRRHAPSSGRDPRRHRRGDDDRRLRARRARHPLDPDRRRSHRHRRAATAGR